MKITKDINGIIFDVLEYKDNDLIVSVLSKEYGFMQLYVKGGAKVTSKSFYIIKQFNEITFDVSKLNIDSLSLYKSGTNISVFDYTSLSYNQINACLLLAELFNKIKEIDNFDYVKYYDFIKKYLESIKQNNNIYYLINLFLYNTLVILGAYPIIDKCVICNNDNSIVGFDIENFGFVCKNCQSNAYILKDKVVLTTLYEINNQELKSSSSKSSNKIIMNILTNYLSENTGVNLVSRKYIY
ncbi:DNA repair protein RecO [Mycoplasma sp. P36-A1]|uniref:DNA repair protein RecO n=1 Tax=Mycoplasma sp. P36-A1 TaxID=3252900 RepID=UPI003C2ED186